MTTLIVQGLLVVVLLAVARALSLEVIALRSALEFKDSNAKSAEHGTAENKKGSSNCIGCDDGYIGNSRIRCLVCKDKSPIPTDERD